MSAATTTATITPQLSAEDIKMYHDELKEWKAANNVAAGVILSSILDEVEHVVDPEESAKDMYNKLKAEILKQSSGSSAFSMRIKLINKKFKEKLTLDSFKKHLTFYHSKNATLLAVSAGFDDLFLAFLLLYSFSSLEDPIWSMASTNITMSDIPINRWSFNQIVGKLREALHSSTHSAEASTSGNNQSALNTATNKLNLNCYTRPACTYHNCWKLKTHPLEKCWTKERDEKKAKEAKEDKKHKAKKAKKKAAVSSSESESGPEPSGLELDCPKEKRHHVKTLRNLKVTIDCVHSYCVKTPGDGLFIAHPDSGALNHMTHKKELFNQSLFKELQKLIPVSLRDDSEIFATGKGTICLLFNVDGKTKEGKFDDVLYVPDLKVTLLSVGQSARLPH